MDIENELFYLFSLLNYRHLHLLQPCLYKLTKYIKRENLVFHKKTWD